MRDRSRPDESELRRALSHGVLSLDTEDILRLLPHRPPMLLIDRVLSLVPGHHGIGMKAVTGNEYGLVVRQHGFIFPATIALESLAQLAALVLLYPVEGKITPGTAPVDGTAGSLVSAVHTLEVLHELAHPDVLHLDVVVLNHGEDTVTIQGEAASGGKPYVHARFDLGELPVIRA